MSTEQTARIAMRMPAPSYTLTVGRESFEVDSLTHASILFQELRDASGCDSSKWPQGYVEVEGITYRISYNGRVWNGASVYLEAC